MKCVGNEAEKLQIIKDSHRDAGAHLGIRKTYYKITERFAWKGIMNDVWLVNFFRLIIIHFTGLAINFRSKNVIYVSKLMMRLFIKNLSSTQLLSRALGTI